MQVLLGLNSGGHVELTELLSPLRPIQMLQLARMRWAHFAAVEIWDEAVCVLRLPPELGSWNRDDARTLMGAPPLAKAG